MQIDLLANALFYAYKIVFWEYDISDQKIAPLIKPEYDFETLIQSEIPQTDWIRECIQTDSIKLYSSSLGFLWTCLPHNSCIYLIGPISISTLSRKQIASALSSKNYSVKKAQLLTEIYQHLPMFPYLEMQRLIHFIHYLITEEELGTGYEFTGIKTGFQYNDEESYYTQERNFVASRKTEKQIKEWVSKGEVEKVKTFNQHMVPKIGHLSNSPIRQVQNSFIVFMTIVGRAAIDGGLPIEIVHPLTDMYIMQCELLKDISMIWQLHQTMMIDMTRRVKDFKYKLKYSDLINRCCGYILSNVNSPIKIQDIAAHLHVNAEYLSRKFKKETTISIIQYIHNAKISEAKDLLTYTDMTLAQITAKLGFSSQSQFTTIFKANTNMTPGQFRQKK